MNLQISLPKSSLKTDFGYKITAIPLYQNDGYSLATVDNNDTVSYGCIRVALELQPSVRKGSIINVGVRLNEPDPKVVI